MLPAATHNAKWRIYYRTRIRYQAVTTGQLNISLEQGIFNDVA
jgi:hypothetical protein